MNRTQGVGMPNWNGRLLCAIDIETTGLDPETSDIVQLAIVPLGSELEPLDFNISKVKPINIYLQPSKPLEEYKRNPDLAVAYKAIEAADQYGIPFSVFADQFVEIWFAGVQRAGYRQILPLAHNWRFDGGFLCHKLGQKNYDYVFSPHFRDTMVIGSFLNDVASIMREEYPFPKLGLNSMTTHLGLERYATHDALEDALFCARLYGVMLRNYITFWGGPVKSYEIPKITNFHSFGDK